MEVAIWLTDGPTTDDDPGGSCWSCTECRRDRALHRRRGRCGGLFDLALAGADVNADGDVAIPGGEVVAGARGSFGAREFTSCPLVLASDPEVRAMFDVYARQRDQRLLHPPKLSAAGAAALDAAARAEADLRAAQRARLKLVRG